MNNRDNSKNRKHIKLLFSLIYRAPKQTLLTDLLSQSKNGPLKRIKLSKLTDTKACRLQSS